MSTLLARDKERILEYILSNPTKNVGVRDIAKVLGLSPAHVSRTLKELRNNNIISDNVVNLANPMVNSLKVFFNIKLVQEKDIINKLTTAEISGAGIYGSWANGTNHEDSDLDIWIKVRKHPGETKIASISGELRKALGRRVQILILTPERIKRLKDNDPAFYYSLVHSSINLWGETIE
ncbi:MAG: winged helix-turn-helix transcriptional regulator [Chloroflexi bacterium]|nr:winged helix-turn-helix transcriptional regulator [Chloroflexota bacterium]